MAKCSTASRVFVTVGTTTFDRLIEEILRDETLAALKQLGCRCFTLQHGSCQSLISSLETFKQRHHRSGEFEIVLFDYCDTIEPYIEAADLVIGHAGAGTSLEVMRKGKPLLIVINDTLMGNHQEELAQELAEQGYVMCAYPSTLRQTLQSLDFANLKPFPKHDPERFRNFFSNALADAHR